MLEFVFLQDRKPCVRIVRVWSPCPIETSSSLVSLVCTVYTATYAKFDATI